jgi:ABC-type sulfate transport system permease subunit
MDEAINKGISIVLALIFLPVALLVFGQLGTGTSSFWYGINNPNTTGATGATSLLQATVLPIMIAISVAVVVLLGAMKIVKV